MAANDYSNISFQAHQSSTTEVPENTLTAMRYAWDLGGIPEIDIRQTADRIIIGMHDSTPRRCIATAPEDQDAPVKNFTFEQIQDWDAGIKFNERFKGEKIPALSAVLGEMAKDKQRQLYLDFKDVDLDDLAVLLKISDCGNRVIFAYNKQNNCQTVKKLMPQIRTMLWIPDGGEKNGVRCRFNKVKENGFAGLDIVQLHLHDNNKQSGKNSWPYVEEKEFLDRAIADVKQANMQLEVLLQSLSQAHLTTLLEMGIDRFAVDQPSRFVKMLDEIFNP